MIEPKLPPHNSWAAIVDIPSRTTQDILAELQAVSRSLTERRRNGQELRAAVDDFEAVNSRLAHSEGQEPVSKSARQGGNDGERRDDEERARGFAAPRPPTQEGPQICGKGTIGAAAGRL